jgi:uncharacterized protein (TIGR03086 family)
MSQLPESPFEQAPTATALLRAAAAQFEDRLADVTPEQWPWTTPCPEWDVAALVDHVLSEYSAISHDGVPADPPLGERDRLTEWQSETPAALVVVEEAEQCDMNAPFRFGRLPASVGGPLLAAGTLVHCWDLSRALHKDDRLPLDLAATLLTRIAPFGVAMQESGEFGPPLILPPDSPADMALVGFMGRRWS